MDRAQKAETVEALKGVFAGAGVVVVSHYSGLTVADLTVLRNRLRSEGGALKVVKNRLVKLAIGDTPKAAAAELFTGPTAIAYSADPISAAKVAVAYARKRNSSPSSAACSAISCSIRPAFRRSPPCRRSTSCAARSSAWCRRRDQDRWRARSARRSAGSRSQRLRHQGRRLTVNPHLLENTH
ncbi:MAG: 50S ribosomal protein L10 [Hyphomonadaceae bacterium]